ERDGPAPALVQAIERLRQRDGRRVTLARTRFLPADLLPRIGREMPPREPGIGVTRRAGTGQWKRFVFGAEKAAAAVQVVFARREREMVEARADDLDIHGGAHAPEILGYHEGHDRIAGRAAGRDDARGADEEIGAQVALALLDGPGVPPVAFGAE